MAESFRSERQAMDPESFLLSPQGLLAYLVEHGVVPDGRDVKVRELGGGVSNLVFLIEGLGYRWVAKQSLDKLRVKDDWRSERERIFREADAIQALGPVLGDAHVPQVIHVDRENFFFVMTCAPVECVVWKESLLSGCVDLGVARQAGLLLARLVNAPKEIPQLQTRFEDRRVFEQLRIDPYYRTVAARHGDVRPIIEELIADSWRVQTGLVHGDYSPKNILVQKTREPFLIDFEVVHYGDPAFDAAFLLNHLFLKVLFRPQYAPLYFEATREFWKALLGELRCESSGEFEALTLRHLGGLMLARIDGKSPVEYIREEAVKERVRGVAKRILRERPQRLEEAIRLAG